MSKMTPQIRFQGFTDDWEERKSEDLFTPVNERNREDLPVLSVTQNQGVVFRNDLAIDIKYDESTLSSYKVIHPGDFVISLRSFQGGFEMSKVLGISSPAYTIFDLKNPTEHDKLYWKSIFKTFKFIESLKTVTFGIRDGKSISFREFSDLKLKYPSEVAEQKKIGAFFKQLDSTIALHQRKLDLLKEQKKGFLQKMFPKNGAKVPELRFSEFADDWEERKLNENVENIGTGRSSFKAGLDYSEQTPYEVLGSTSVISYSDSFDHSGNFVLTARVGANAGNLYKHSGSVKISDNTVYIQSKNLEFIFYLLTKYDLKKLAFGTGQPLIKASELKNLKLFFPKTFGEQQKIGSFFKQLDDTIALHQRKLDLLKEQKKGFLQKMFVS
ncbi:restriction endonuclease subunit S [Leuconostoc mesenteroides]|uniref:restriction endonuclease subunit S n=1 Tax=Leuconostoc mesenteroides TaxID=1245 RepID=UPI002360E55B|nr:restriction endonuclease subunit S [Leuconostoc mesenteroides]